MANNPFKNSPPGLTGRVRNMILIDVSTTDHSLGQDVAIGLFVTTGGVVNFVDIDGNTTSITVPNNFTINCSVSLVATTGTLATGIYLLMA